MKIIDILLDRTDDQIMNGGSILLYDQLYIHVAFLFVSSLSKFVIN